MAPLRLAMVATALIALPAPAVASSDLIVAVPVPGGLAALARALEIDPPDRAQWVGQLTRVIYGDPAQPSEEPSSALRRVLAHFKAVGQIEVAGARASGNADLVPIPLPAAVWSQAVFRRAVSPNALFAAVMSDEAAALLAHGLSALDDETLQFVANNPAVLTRLYEYDSGVFSAFAAHLHIRNGRVVPPGGERAVPLWEALVNEKVSRPDSFIRELFARDRGRLAYLYDTIGQLDPPQAAFALGLWIDDASLRVVRFRALASTASSAFREWDVRKLPFSRPVHDLLAMLTRVQVAPLGAPRFPASRGVWAYAFDHASWSDEPARVPLNLDDDRPVDAAWLADAVLSPFGWLRAEYLDQLAFGQRRFSGAEAAALPDVLVALQAFRRFRMLMLTLDRLGVGPPAIYAALAQHAHRLSALDEVRGRVALAQFQGAIALVARLTRVQTLDRGRAEALLRGLAVVPLDRNRGYLGALAVWLRLQLGPALAVAVGDDMDDALVGALAGSRAVTPSVPVSWEGQRYQFDLVTSEALRLARVRGQRTDASIDAALRLLGAAHQPGRAALAAESVLERVDALLGEALVAFSYAADWSDARGPAGMATSVASRHDFGFAKSSHLARVRAAWSLPKKVFGRGSPWRVEGAILGLDIALAPLALRRVTSTPPPRAPALNSNDRETFVTSLGLMNPFTLHDAARDAIAQAVARGQRRVEGLTDSRTDADALAREIKMDGWRVRALHWTIAHDAQGIGSLFAMSELLYLGGGRDIDLHAWGMSAIGIHGRLSTLMAPPGLWTALIGRPQVGLLATAVPDLNLRVAVMLHELQLPAALAKSVLAAAVRDYIDEVKPTDPDDWLTLVRTAQRVSRERIEDYIAAATISGPLLPEMTTQSGQLP